MNKDNFRNQLITDYTAELEIALKWKADGLLTVEGDVAGSPNGEDVSIDEYIARWRDGLAALESGADPEFFNY
jgi:hypothetical protein